MKNNIFFFAFALCAILLSVTACKKTELSSDNKIEAAANFDEVDNSTISEEEFEATEDPLYHSEAVSVSITAGATKATDADADGKCTTFKYKDYYKINNTWEDNYYTFKFSQKVNIIDVKNMDSKTGINGSNSSGQKIDVNEFELTGAEDSTEWRVQIRTNSDTFRTGTIKMVFTFFGGKTKSMNIKAIGINKTNGHVFGTQEWGFFHTSPSIDPNFYTGTMSTLDSFFIPYKDGVIAFGTSNTMRAVILNDPTMTPAATKAQRIKGDKYEFKYGIWNATCKGTYKVAKCTFYKYEGSTASPDAGANKLHGYFEQ